VGYRPGVLVVRTSLHDHGGACDIESDEAWMKFTEAVQEAVEEFLPGEFTWVGHVDCQCASCEEEEKDV
jgi:hypothetical protein